MNAYFTEVEIDTIGAAVSGSFYRFEEDCDGVILVFSSHTFPSHRITVREESAKSFLDKAANRIIECSVAD